MRSNYKKIGLYVRQANQRNKDMAVKNLQGININKQFMPSVANTVGVDLSKYKVVSRHQFAFNPMHVGRDEMLPISMLDKDDPVIVSPAYVVFEIKDHEELDPEYLMMWCRRPEFDRNTWFTTDSSVRGGFSWSDFCDMELPVPPIEKQREIVREYNTIVNRIQLNEQMNQKLEETAQAIYKHWFVDFEFPISAEYAASIGKPELEGKPYKSSGGEMVFCAELDQEIPKGWSTKKLDKLYQFQYGKGNNNPDNGGKYPVYGSNGIIGGYNKFNNEDAPVIGHIGANCGSLVYAPGKHYVTYNGVMCNILENYNRFFGYCTLLASDLQSQTRGSSQPFVSYDMLYDLNFIDPDQNVLQNFSEKAEQVFRKQIAGKELVQKLISLRNILLSRMAVIEKRKKIAA